MKIEFDVVQSLIGPIIDQQYDIKPFKPPTTKYWILSSPRSGSVFLAGLLYHTGKAGFPYLYYDWEAVKHLMKRHGYNLESYSSIIQQTRTSYNGYWGCRVHAHHFMANMSWMTNQIKQNKYNIHIRRKDRAMQAVSLYIASMTRSFVQYSDTNKTDTSTINYDNTKIMQLYQKIQIYDNFWVELIRKMQISTLEVWYEDLVENPHGVMDDICRYMDIDPREYYDPYTLEQKTQLNYEFRDRFVVENNIKVD